MPLLSKVILANSRTTTGNEVYTGVGFTPKVLLFFSSNTAITTSTYRMLLGAATSTSARWSISSVDANGATTSTASRSLHTTRCITWVNISEVVIGAADFVSFDSDGFTLNWTTVEGTVRPFITLALGGSDLQSVHASSFDLTTTAGNQAITGTGFQPDLVMLAGTIVNTTETPSSTANFNFGMMTASEQWVTCNIIQDAATVNNTYRLQRTDRCYATLGTDGSISAETTRLSLDSNGFTITKVSLPSTNRRVCYLALKIRGARVKLGAFNVPASTGQSVTTGLGFPPNTLLLASTGIATSTSVTDTALLSIGAAGSDTSNYYCAADSLDNTDPMISDRTAGTGIAATISTLGDLNAYGTDGFTIDWTVTSGGGVEILYAAMGGPPHAGTVYVTGTDDVDTWQFTSLASCINYMKTNYPALTTDNGSGAPGPLNIEISSTTADSQVIIDGFVTGPTNYLNIYTVGAARHAGVWDSSKHKIQAMNVVGALAIRDNYVRIDGLQVDLIQAFANFQAALCVSDGFIDPANDIRISNCLVRASGDTFRVPAFFIEDSSAIVTMWNCIGYANGGEDHQFSAGLALSNTSISAYSCVFVGAVGLSAFTTTTATVKNCYAHSIASLNAWYGGGGATITYTTCAASDTSADGTALDSIPYSTATFTNVTAGSEDFRLVSGSGLIDVGTDTTGDTAPLNFTTDIASTTRTGTWDIGAFTFTSGAPTGTPRTFTYILG